MFITQSPRLESRAHELLEKCRIPYHDNDLADHSQLAHSILNDVAQKSITNFLEWLKGKLLVSLEMCDKSFIKYNFSNLGTYEGNFLNFSLAQDIIFSARYANAEDSLSNAFTNCLNKPSLISKDLWFVYVVVFFLLNIISDWPILA